MSFINTLSSSEELYQDPKAEDKLVTLVFIHAVNCGQKLRLNFESKTMPVLWGFCLLVLFEFFFSPRGQEEEQPNSC